jgi:hypothetical protein
MKEWLTIYKNILNKYSADRLSPSSSLYDLYMFITNDYHAWDTEFFTKPVRVLNITYIFNDLENQVTYIGVHYDDEDHEIFQPDGPGLENYVNETNSCKMSINNFNEFIKKWLEIKENQYSFAAIYRNDNDWVDCKGFNFKEEMEFFVQNYQPNSNS